MGEKTKRLLTLALSATVAMTSGFAALPAKAAVNTPTDMDAFNVWNTSEWDNLAEFDSGKVVQTPGKTASEMNYAWYSATVGTPQVRIASDYKMTENVKTFTGTASSINRTNETNTYAASNKVTVTGLEESSVYFYSYSIDGTNWSDAQQFNTQKTSSLQVLCFGDPQIGASSGSNDIAYDTFQWNATIESALGNHPDANFLLSVGDQINQSSDGSNGGVQREKEYAGFLYPDALRSVPLATGIGNHESLSADYSMHYNNPNTQDNLGKTASGCDYYFNYGKVLFIVLNSNNRNAAEHDELMNKAINDSDSANAKWKIAVMHHDIYGTGAPHSDVDGANLRALFAPLMDKYNVDVCLTGHDHSYARSYQIVDGKAITYNMNTATNPQGTLYMALNSATGSKFYDLNSTKQYYIDVRNQLGHPNYSVLSINGGNLSIKTMDVINNAEIDEYSITKTAPKESLYNLIGKAEGMTSDSAYAAAYTAESRTALEKALASAKALLDMDNDNVPEDFYGKYDNTIQGSNPEDKINYYAYDTQDGGAVESGYCAFLDKTKDNQQALLTSGQVFSAYQLLNNAIDGLAAVSDTTKDSTETTTTTSSSSSASEKTTAAETSATTSAVSTDNPVTGDNTNAIAMILFGVLAAASGTVITLQVRKKAMAHK